MALLPYQCRMARMALGWGIVDLARMADVSPDTIARLERGARLRSRTVDAITRAFQSAAVHFVEGGAPGVTCETIVPPPVVKGGKYVFKCLHRGQEVMVSADKKITDRYVATLKHIGLRPGLDRFSIIAIHVHGPIAAAMRKLSEQAKPLPRTLVLSKADFYNVVPARGQRRDPKNPI